MMAEIVWYYLSCNHVVTINALDVETVIYFVTDAGPYRSSFSNCSAVRVPSMASQSLLNTE